MFPFDYVIMIRLWQFAMPETREKKIDSVLQPVVFTMPARPIKFTKYCLTQWISKLPVSFEIHWVGQY